MPVQLSKEGASRTLTDAELIIGGDAETTYTVRLLTREARKAIIAKHTKKVPGPNHFMVDTTDREAVNFDLCDYALVAWTGILVDGQPVPCERDYKFMLDEVRLAALLEAAGLSQVVAAEVARPDSFRPPA